MATSLMDQVYALPSALQLLCLWFALFVVLGMPAIVVLRWITTAPESVLHMPEEGEPRPVSVSTSLPIR